jgi:hypothetical protein
MKIVQGNYTDAELQRGRYVVEKINKLIERGPFPVMFDSIAGALFGYGIAAGLSVEEILQRLLYLTKHDSPDGRTAQQVVDAFKKDGTAS